MIPFRLTKEQFRDRYRRCLERLSPNAISALRKQIALPFSPDATGGEVQVFMGEDEPFEPSVWLYVLGKGAKVDSNDQTLFPGRSIELPLGLGGLETFDPRFFVDERFGGTDIAAGVLAAWFAECWWKAGGWDYPFHVELTVHDGYGQVGSVRLTAK